MARITAREKIEIFASLADVKEANYRNLLALAALVDLLVEKGILDRQEIARRARELDSEALEDIRSQSGEREAR